MFHACWKGNSCGFLTCSNSADSVESPVKIGKQGSKCFLIQTHTHQRTSLLLTNSQYCFVPSATKKSLIHPFRHCCMNLFQLYFFFFSCFFIKKWRSLKCGCIYRGVGVVHSVDLVWTWRKRMIFRSEMSEMLDPHSYR